MTQRHVGWFAFDGSVALFGVDARGVIPTIKGVRVGYRIRGALIVSCQSRLLLLVLPALWFDLAIPFNLVSTHKENSSKGCGNEQSQQPSY